MVTTVVDSNNLEQILAHAAGENPEPPTDQAAANAEDTSAADKSAETSTETSETEQEDDDGLTESQRREFTKSMQKTIGKKHRQMKEAEEFAAAQYREKVEAERRAAELERQLEETRRVTQPEQKEEKEPAREDFATDAEYLKAAVAYETSQRMKEFMAQTAEQQVRQRAGERVDRARELVPDFDSVVKGATMPIPAAVGKYMESSEMIAELAYHFAKNPDVLESLHKKSGVSQLVELGKIEAKLAPFAKAKAEVSKPQHGTVEEVKKPTPSDETAIAPSKTTRESAPVINPLNTSATTAHEKSASEMNVRDMIESWQNKTGTNLTRRKRH